VPSDPHGSVKMISGDVLIVEDNLIIAMETEDKLQSLGADRCHIAGSAAVALEIIARHPPSFAVLDVNLGVESSEAVALKLAEDNVPFLIASGYGDDLKELPAYANATAVIKPYSRAELIAAISRCLAALQS